MEMHELEVELNLYFKDHPEWEINYYGGYAVDENGIIHTHPSASSFVASYDGCTVAEMKSDYSSYLRGY